MATLQKFKLFATQCSIIGSPTRNPTTSPVVHIRRRKTLRMLLGKFTGSDFQRRFLNSYRRDNNGEAKQQPPQPNSARLKLKDLFVSSPPLTEYSEVAERLLKVNSGGDSAVVAKSGGVRVLSATLRQRLLMRRALRPVLVGIPEVSP